MKKISVIVPVYNMEERLECCLNSIVNQTYKNIEIIVINDGSEDSSIDIIKKFKLKHDNFVAINRKNKGVSYSRNEGLDKATGYYVAFVDSDDFIELDMYEKMIEEIEANNADIVVCDYVMFNKDGINKYIKVIDNIKNIKENPKVINEMDFGPCNKVFKKELFNNIRFPLDTKYEDLNAILKVCYKAKKIAKLNKAFYHYFNNPSGETRTIDIRIYDIFKILDDLLKYFNKENISNKFKNEIEYLCINKVFVYCEISAQYKDSVFTKQLLKESYNFINKNFNNWRLKYIIRSKGHKITRFLQIFPKVYKIKLVFKSRR